MATSRRSARIAAAPKVSAPVAAVSKTASTAAASKKRTAASDATADASKKTKPSSANPAAAAAVAAPAAAVTSKASAGSNTLKVGDKLPSISLQDDTSKTVDVGSLTKSVIFTYPKANTGGCTTQACLYRDEYAQFQKAGFAVYGLSNDGITSLKNWKEKKSFPYALLSDPKRELIGALTGSKSSTPRSHFVIDAQGKLALSSVSVKPAESSPAALKFAQAL